MLTYKRGTGWVEGPEYDQATEIRRNVRVTMIKRAPEPNETGWFVYNDVYHKSASEILRSEGDYIRMPWKAPENDIFQSGPKGWAVYRVTPVTIVLEPC